MSHSNFNNIFQDSKRPTYDLQKVSSLSSFHYNIFSRWVSLSIILDEDRHSIYVIMTTITSNIDTINIECLWCLLYVVIISVPIVITKKKGKISYHENVKWQQILSTYTLLHFFFFLSSKVYVIKSPIFSSSCKYFT